MNEHHHGFLLGIFGFLTALGGFIVSHIQQVDGVAQLGLICLSAAVTWQGWKRVRK